MRFTPDGTIFFKKESHALGLSTCNFVVQLNHHLGGGGAPFKTLKWATWKNPYMPLDLQETNEDPNMYGWSIASPTDLVLFASKETLNNIEVIQELINLGYKGQHNTPYDVFDKIRYIYGDHKASY